MNNNLKFGLSQVRNRAPKWVINSTSIVALLIAAKHYLVEDLPGMTTEMKQLFMSWFEYGLNITQVLLALLVIFLGQEGTHYDKTRNIDNR